MSTVLDLGAVSMAVPTSVVKPLGRNTDLQSEYALTGFDSTASTTIGWFSYGDPQTNPAPTTDTVINVSATRIR